MLRVNFGSAEMKQNLSLPTFCVSNATKYGQLVLNRYLYDFLGEFAVKSSSKQRKRKLNFLDAQKARKNLNVAF
jgi:hypothetical protein